MKAGIHPAYNELNVICAVAHVQDPLYHKGDIAWKSAPTAIPSIQASKKLMDTAGRIDGLRRSTRKAAPPRRLSR